MRRRGKHFYFSARRARASGTMFKARAGPARGRSSRVSNRVFQPGRVGSVVRVGRERAGPAPCPAPPRGARTRPARAAGRALGGDSGVGGRRPGARRGFLVERRRRRRATKPNARRTFRGTRGGSRARPKMREKSNARGRGRWRARRAPLGLGAAARTSPMACCSSLAEGGRPGGHGRSPTGLPGASRASPIRQPPRGWARADRERAPRAVLRRFGAATTPTRANARAASDRAAASARARESHVRPARAKASTRARANGARAVG